MAEVIKVYVEHAPACRLVGKRYTQKDSKDGSYAHLWQEWFREGRFQILEGLLNPDFMAGFPEAGSFLGFMRMKEPDRFDYWIGLFAPTDAPVPEGFNSLDLPEMTCGVGWIKGTEPQIYWEQHKVMDALLAQGYQPFVDEEGCSLMVERYQCPRFTSPEESGEKVLDILLCIQAPADQAAEDISQMRYCAACRQAFTQEKCPGCQQRGTKLQMDDPIYIGELPGRLRNALQIDFGATEIPFNALANLGSGFTLSAGDLFESYRIYVPYERAEEARAAFQSVFDINQEDA